MAIVNTFMILFQIFGCILSNQYRFLPADIWVNGSSNCELYGMEFATIKNPFTMRDFSEIFLSLKDEYKHSAWIGLSWNENKNMFNWIDGDALSLYTYWRSGEPDCIGNHSCISDQHCVKMTQVDYRMFEWRTAKCTRPFPILCIGSFDELTNRTVSAVSTKRPASNLETINMTTSTIPTTSLNSTLRIFTHIPTSVNFTTKQGTSTKFLTSNELSQTTNEDTLIENSPSKQTRTKQTYTTKETPTKDSYTTNKEKSTKDSYTTNKETPTIDITHETDDKTTTKRSFHTEVTHTSIQNRSSVSTDFNTKTTQFLTTEPSEITTYPKTSVTPNTTASDDKLTTQSSTYTPIEVLMQTIASTSDILTTISTLSTLMDQSDTTISTTTTSTSPTTIEITSTSTSTSNIPTTTSTSTSQTTIETTSASTIQTTSTTHNSTASTSISTISTNNPTTAPNTSPNIHEQINPSCLCPCGTTHAPLIFDEEKLRQIEEILKVKKKETGAFMRSLSSAEDKRLSSRVIGYVGTVILSIVLVIILLTDMTRFFYNILNIRGLRMSFE